MDNDTSRSTPTSGGRNGSATPYKFATGVNRNITSQLPPRWALQARDKAAANDYLAALCWRLGRMVAGNAAAALQERLITQGPTGDIAGDGPHQAGVAVLPVWVWLPPKVDMGRKGAGLVPVRLTYQRLGAAQQPITPADDIQTSDTQPEDVRDNGPIHLVPAGGDVEVAWRARGAGWDTSGTLSLRPGPLSPALSGPDGRTSSHNRPRHAPASCPGRSPIGARPSPDGMPQDILPPTSPVALAAGGVLPALDELAQDGGRARWEIITELETMVRKYLWRARSRVLDLVEQGELYIPAQRAHGGDMPVQRARSSDISLHDGGDWLSGPVLDTLADEIVLGPDGRRSRADRLLERCLLPGTFNNVDPLRYVATSLRCTAVQAVQRHLGDPAAGAGVRRVAAQLSVPRDRPLSPEDIQLVLKEFQAAHPKERLGPARAARALEFYTAALAPMPAQRHRSNGTGARSGHNADHSAKPSTQRRLHIAPDVTASEIVRSIVEHCRSEGGNDLATVAQRWLTAVAAGEDVNIPALAQELWVSPEQARSLMAAAQATAARASIHDGAA